MPDAGAPILAEDSNPWVIVSRFRDSTSGAISTSEAVEGTATISIPAYWNTYDLDAIALCRIIPFNSPSGNSTITHQLKLGTTTGGTSGGVSSSQVGSTAPDSTEPGSLGGDWTGLTSTGTVSVVWTMVSSSGNNTWGWDDISIKLIASRTS